MAKPSLLYAISPYTKYPDESAAFMNFLLNNKDCAEILGTSRGIPASEYALEQLRDSGMLSGLSMENSVMLDKLDIITVSPYMELAQVKNMCNSAIEKISYGSWDTVKAAEELYQSLNKLGIKIFYDKESLEWGDNWKDRILNGTKKAEFAIIVISQNFFDREWTERELSEFLNRQNRNGQKLILPILHNITVSQLQEKYPSIADIQAIDSSKYSCDQIALLFARQLIKRLKSE